MFRSQIHYHLHLAFVACRQKLIEALDGPKTRIDVFEVGNIVAGVDEGRGEYGPSQMAPTPSHFI